MKRACVIGITVAGLLAGAMVHAQSPRSAEVQMKAAQQKAEVEGDLKGAIEEYKKVIAMAGANRALAAQALVRMAECYQKLGDAQARAIYDRVVREYADQKDVVAIALMRIGAIATTSAKGDRAAWSGPFVDGFGTISPDGRFLTYTDWPGAAGLVLRDLVNGTERRLTAGTVADGQTQFSTISRDGQQVAYQWRNGRAPGRYELRVASLRGTGIPESRRVYDNEDVDGVAPFDWSPDGKSIAVHVARKDLTGQIGIVDVETGRLRMLKSIGWGGPRKIFFSPDGKHIAFDLPDPDDANRRDVYTMAVDGSREIAAIAHPSQNTIMGWSPDGRYLLFATDRTGSTGLWALRMLDGKPQGAPEQVKSDIGSSWSLGLTSNGTMYVWKDTRAPYVQVSEIDLKAGTLGRNVFQEFISSRGRPDWSADGKHLAYVPCASLGDGPCSLRIWSADTGRTRDVRHKLRYVFFPRWSPDGVSLLASGTNPKGRGSVYRIDVQTGDTIPLTDFRAGNPQWAADGQHIYYPRPRGQNGGRIIVKRTLFSGQESDLVQGPDYATDFLVSRDGRSVVFPVSEPSRPSTIVVTSSNGGESRVLARANPRERWGFLASWTPDGSAVLVAKMFADSDHKELWLVPLTGEPRKLNIDADAWNVGDGFRLSPDGRHIAFVGQAGKSNTEIWALENVVPNGKSSGR